jgi:tetratricopeptide (TPR) repeat protein
MYSTILNSDFFAAYLVMTIPLSLSMFFVEDRVRFKAIAVATFLLMNVCLVFTNSNDSFMSMILITYPVYFLLGFTHLKELNLSRRVLVTFFSGSAMLLATGLLLMLPKLQQTWDFKAAALEGRKVLWLGGFWPWLYRNDPSMQNLDIVSILFGTGPGGYRFYFPVFRRADFFDNQINNVTTFGHNYYIDILCEFGIAGLLLFLVFYGRVLYDGVRQVLRTGNHAHRFYQTACVAGLSGIALQNFFSPNNRWAVCGMVFYAMFGLSMGLHQIDNPGEERPTDATSPRPGPFVAKIFLGLLAGLFLFRSVPQGFSHFQGAMANGRGLTYMEIAERYEGAKQTQWLQMARDSFEEAIRLNPTFATSYYKVAHVYNQLGQIDKAIEKYEALERYNPNYSEIHLNLGIMYSVKSGDLSGAAQLKLIQKAYKEIKEGARQELKPNVQWIAGTIGHQLADLYEELGDNLKTDAGLTEGAASPNKDGNELALELRNEIKQYYRNIVTYKPQLEEFRMERKKYYVRAQVKLVELAYLTDNLGEAEDVLKQMYTDEPDKPEYLAQLVSFFDKQGKRKEKVEFLDNAVHNAPTDTRLRRALATGYKELGETAKYLTELRRIEVLNPKDRSALTNLYLNYQSAGDAAKAAEYRTKLQAAGFNTDKLTTLTADDDSTTGDIDTIPDAEQALLKNEEGTSKASAVAAPSNPRTAQALATTESDASPTTEPAGTVPAAPATTAVEGITSK